MISPTWLDYRQGRNEHTVTGSLRVLHELWSPQLENQRDILVYLPASYENLDKRYPVIYMHDGQNLFDELTSYVGEWRVDETMQILESEGVEAIIVGIPHTGDERLNEYSPFKHRRLGGGRGDDYLNFIVQTVKPLIDSSFRTMPGRDHTGMIGSSMGGLISLYGYFRHPQVFGFVGAMSPALWFAQKAIYPYVAAAPFTPGRIYLDAGTEEAHGRQYFPTRFSWSVDGDARQMRDSLVEKGYHEGEDLLYVEEEGAPHHESAWSRRLPDALRWLLQTPPMS